MMRLGSSVKPGLHDGAVEAGGPEQAVHEGEPLGERPDVLLVPMACVMASASSSPSCTHSRLGLLRHGHPRQRRLQLPPQPLLASASATALASSELLPSMAAAAAAAFLAMPPNFSG
ncbi:hypothetical protein ZWY2020_042334 [Hordeum vulgare]|nr:hypothetical protein ZWY2020_042334 [Hordeum vulgare]